MGVWDSPIHSQLSQTYKPLMWRSHVQNSLSSVGFFYLFFFQSLILFSLKNFSKSPLLPFCSQSFVMPNELLGDFRFTKKFNLNLYLFSKINYSAICPTINTLTSWFHIWYWFGRYFTYNSYIQNLVQFNHVHMSRISRRF